LDEAQTLYEEKIIGANQSKLPWPFWFRM